MGLHVYCRAKPIYCRASSVVARRWRLNPVITHYVLDITHYVLDTVMRPSPDPPEATITVCSNNSQFQTPTTITQPRS